MIGWLFIALLAAALGPWVYWSLTGRRTRTFREALAPAEPRPDDADLPAVTVICPGRNEAEHLPHTLPTLAGQDYPNLRVIFVDDASEDDTPRITAELAARYPNLTVVRNEEHPPPGWVGKCWAVYQGYQALGAARLSGQRPEAREFVCFTDADIHWEPHCLRTAVRHALERDAGIVALFPQLEFGSTSERLVQSAVFLGFFLLFPFDKAMDPAYPEVAMTGGAFMLIRRDWYDRVGGHEAVRSCIIEDLNLGRTLKRAGAPIRSVLAPKLLRCRMYEGWADMWEGFTKNIYAGVDYSPWRFAAFMLGMLVTCVLPPLYLLGAAAWAAMRPGAAAPWVALGLAGATFILQTRIMNHMRQHVNLPWRYAFSLPLGALLSGVIACGSVWRYYFGGNVWKGRRYGRGGA